MPWFRLDDNFHGHPKVRAAGNAATGLWVRCATYSAHYLTDGHIDTAIAHSYGTDRQINQLTTTRLWIPDDTGYLIPDYLDYNPSEKQVQNEREKARKRRAESRFRTSS